MIRNKLIHIVSSIMIIFCLSACTETNSYVTQNPAADTDNTSAASTAFPTAAPAFPENSSFEVHYIDVRQADAALVICDNRSLLIDGGNAEDSDLIAAYLKKENISTLDYAVCTHAHEGHVGGLSGALSAVSVNNGYSPCENLCIR